MAEQITIKEHLKKETAEFIEKFGEGTIINFDMVEMEIERSGDGFLTDDGVFHETAAAAVDHADQVLGGAFDEDETNV